MNNATRLRRLNHFVTVLEAVPMKKFYMGAWAQSDYFDEPLEVTVPKTFIEVDCQTAGCALGWAAMDKKFILAGLTVKANRSSGTVRFKGDLNDNAGRNFFGIEHDEAWQLFNPIRYEGYVEDIKPLHVIAKLKQLIKKYGVER